MIHMTNNAQRARVILECLLGRSSGRHIAKYLKIGECNQNLTDFLNPKSNNLYKFISNLQMLLQTIKCNSRQFTLCSLLKKDWVAELWCVIADLAGAKNHRRVPIGFSMKPLFITSSSKCLRSRIMKESN